MYYGQSSIDADGFRSLREGEVVEFFVETGEDGRMKAVKVTGPDGAPPQACPRAARLTASAASHPFKRARLRLVQAAQHACLELRTYITSCASQQ